MLDAVYVKLITNLPDKDNKFTLKTLQFSVQNNKFPRRGFA